MLKLGIILALYAAAACVGLAFVYAGTASLIEERAKADQDAALKALFPDADGFKDITGAIPRGDPAVSFSQEFQISRGSAVIGVAVQTSRGSYGGPLKTLVGVGADGKIAGIKILEHSDTPGLGANAGSPGYYIDRARGLHFYDQFAGKSVQDPFEPKSDVIAITAATITSRAVSASVKAAGLAASAWLAAKGGSK
jgi:electron transport complex protein RnfG